MVSIEGMRTIAEEESGALFTDRIRQFHNSFESGEDQRSRNDDVDNKESVQNSDKVRVRSEESIQTGKNKRNSGCSKQIGKSGRLQPKARCIRVGDDEYVVRKGDICANRMGRYVCNKSKQKAPKVCLAKMASRGFGVRRILSGLAGAKGVCTSSNKIITKNNSENRSGESRGDSSVSVLAVSDLVATTGSVVEQKISTGAIRGDLREGKIHEEKGYETPTGGVNDGKNLVDEVRDINLHRGLSFIEEVLRQSGWRNQLVRSWFLEQSDSTVRSRLKGIALFGEWCLQRNMGQEEVAKTEKPERLLEECIDWVYEKGGSYTSADICRTAVSALYRDWFNKNKVGENKFVQFTLRKKAMTRVPQGRKKRIWDIGVLLDAFRKEIAAVNLENLSWDKMIGRVGMMILVYTCCRIQDMYNIVPQKVEWNEDWRQWLIPMKTKVSAGRLKFKVLLQIMDDEGVCPVKTMEFYLKKWKELSKEQRRFFIRKDGEPIESVRGLSPKFLLPYIRNAALYSLFREDSSDYCIIQ
jgi:hypothetical protein